MNVHHQMMSHGNYQPGMHGEIPQQFINQHGQSTSANMYQVPGLPYSYVAGQPISQEMYKNNYYVISQLQNMNSASTSFHPNKIPVMMPSNQNLQVKSVDAIPEANKKKLKK